MSERPNLKNYSIDALRRRMSEWGLEPWRAEQLAGWLYQRGIDDPERMTDLPREVRARLEDEWSVRALELAQVAHSVDGTTKAVLRARDGSLVEAVLIPEETRNTLCVSSQVGCPLACSFCATGAFGFRRNLSTAEIVDQVCRMREFAGERAITNIVFMGMGEPLLNLPAVSEAIRLLVHPKAFGMAPRRVTVSTVGLVPLIGRLLSVAPINLAVSLHATTDEVRDRLVPMGRRFPLKSLLSKLRELDSVSPRRPVFFEYTLIAGVNDSLDDAKRLAPLLRGIPSKLNLIPMNPHADSGYRAPDEDATLRFLRTVAATGLFVSLRRSRGSDVDAACGQLALRSLAESAA